jgi:hypothetical protein
MKIKFGIFFLFLFAAIFLTKCYYDSEESLYPQVSSECDTTNVTYSTSVKPILQNYCYACHNTANAPSLGSNINLEDYNILKQEAEQGFLLGAIKHESGFAPMPDGGGKLKDCDILIIQKWVEAGAPNN